MRAPRRSTTGPREFITVLALSMALAALGIDLLLPAFDAMRADLRLDADSTAVAGAITTYFLGLAVGQLAYGPLSDRFGRRRGLQAGFLIYGVGALASALSPSLSVLLLARFVWGLGAAGFRVLAVAMIRDRYSGDRMSRAMSFVMAVFIVVPVIAPTLGAMIVALVSWRWLPGVCMIAVALIAFWARRLPETLAPEHRLDLTVSRLTLAARFVTRDRIAVGYTLGMAALYGCFTSYLASSEIIIGRTFGRPEAFPFVFGGLALVMGGAMLANARMVERVGTRRLAHAVLLAYLAATVVFLTVAVVTDGRPALWLFLVTLAPILAAHAFLIPNLNTIAMTSMGAVAGTAASLIGFVQVGLGAALGAVLDRAFDGTVLPHSYGFLVYTLLALLAVGWAERGRMFRPLQADPSRVAPPVTEM